MPAPSTPSTASRSLPTGFKSIVESIMMEAAEKCEEIDVKCDEEYQVLRRKEISEQGEIIEKADKKRREAVLRDDRVCYTKFINNFRLAQLKAKNDIYHDILKITKQRIAKDSSSKYQKLLENSLTQAMYMLLEPEVFITCKKKDQSIISSTFPSAASVYEKNTKLSVSIGFSKRTLPENSSGGGMLVSNKAETVTVDCSLESRVDQVCHLAMPMIVEMLFSGVQTMKDSPKLSLQKALSPSPQENRMLKRNELSESPPPNALLQERLGIGTSKLDLHGPADDKHSEGGQGGRPNVKNTTRSSEPNADAKRSTTKSSPPTYPDGQGPSSKKP